MTTNHEVDSTNHTGLDDNDKYQKGLQDLEDKVKEMEEKAS